VLSAADAGPAQVFGLAAFEPALKPPAVAEWLRFAPARHPHAHDVNRHGDDIAAYCVTGSEPVNAWDVQDAIEALQAALGPDLLRLKAIVQLDEDPERPVILHAVKHILHPPGRLAAWPDGPRTSRLVVIARGPERAAVPGVLARFLPSLAPVDHVGRGVLTPCCARSPSCCRSPWRPASRARTRTSSSAPEWISSSTPRGGSLSCA